MRRQRQYRILCVCSVAMGAGAVQTAAQEPMPRSLHFEVAAVKLNNSGAGNSYFGPLPINGGRFRGVNVPLRELLKRALNVQDYEVDAPGWLVTQLWYLNALVPGGRAWTPGE